MRRQQRRHAHNIRDSALLGLEDVFQLAWILRVLVDKYIAKICDFKIICVFCFRSFLRALTVFVLGRVCFANWFV